MALDPLIYYLALTVITIIGQIVAAAMSIIIARRLNAVRMAVMLSVAMIISLVRTLYNLPLFIDPAVADFIDVFATPNYMLVALLQPLAIWLVAGFLVDMNGRIAPTYTPKQRKRRL